VSERYPRDAEEEPGDYGLNVGKPTPRLPLPAIDPEAVTPFEPTPLPPPRSGDTTLERGAVFMGRDGNAHAAKTPLHPRRVTLAYPEERPARMRWEAARAESPVRAAWRTGRPHPDAVNEWLWIVAKAPSSVDGWLPVIAFKVYAGFGTASPLQSTALSSVEDWRPVIVGTPVGDRVMELVALAVEGKIAVRRVDPEHEAQFFQNP